MRSSRAFPLVLAPGATAVLGLAAALPLASCGERSSTSTTEEAEPRLLTFQQPGMGTLFTIRAWSPDRGGGDEALERAVDKAFAEVERLDGIYSDYRPDSELNRLAAAPAGEWHPVSGELFALLQRCESLHRETDGAFDPTVGPLVRLWRRARKNHRLPTEEELAEARSRFGFDRLDLDPETRSVRKEAERMIFDLGGIAKGVAADAALRILREEGFPRALVAASGDIALGDPPPEAEGWTIGLESLDLSVEKQDLETVILANAAVSTSGDTRQFVEIDGVRYSHIVDPGTGLGLTERIAVSVIAPDATTSDSCATAASILGAKRGLQFIENTRGIEGRITTLEEGREIRLRSHGFPRGKSAPRQERQEEKTLPAP